MPRCLFRAPCHYLLRAIAGTNFITGPQRNMEVMMNEDVFNTSIRKFLKRLGVTAQREIEKAVRQGLAEGKLKGNERLPAEATVTLGAIGLSLEIKGEIDLDE